MPNAVTIHLEKNKFESLLRAPAHLEDFVIFLNECREFENWFDVNYLWLLLADKFYTFAVQIFMKFPQEKNVADFIAKYPNRHAELIHVILLAIQIKNNNSELNLNLLTMLINHRSHTQI